MSVEIGQYNKNFRINLIKSTV